MNKRKIADKVVEAEKKKLRRKVKKAVRRAVLGICGGLCLLGTGYFLGVHRRVLKAYLKGEPLPEAPKGHLCH